MLQLVGFPLKDIIGVYINKDVFVSKDCFFPSSYKIRPFRCSFASYRDRMNLKIQSENLYISLFALISVIGEGEEPTMRACAKLFLVGLSVTTELGAIIRSAVISINTFLDAHTRSQWRGTKQSPRPSRMWPAACRQISTSQELITTRQPPCFPGENGMP